ncbi:TonB-dependent receptor [Phocaeicola plebeius]|jgi:TonB-linked SusC/RagA family outer membrane protein|uniref:TonB-dependent receptor n=1 Tax=Phocaeicola plebeius TaxID=310297 RepID=A0A3E4Z842_9BACT|nr:TonB-dependent receptor [Phocaeicola plebeius]MBD9352238.1 TonB-dependent receptor [Phocaeicola plebeius]RGM91003.1 TonB-dependent receptor [Phocaeicola plebeius]RGQ74163.1 TonB-dependent receptor [Phocaeicola plebeius]RGR46276.1 TonB-dependent receptor [Phocaeicola plebeius]
MSSKTCFAKSSCIVLASALFCTSLPALATSSTAGTNLAVQQQDQKLKGQVIDATTGEPVIGVNVLVKGSTNGTITDIDGKYELNAPAGAILQISFIGYKTVEIAATTSEQTIKLHEDTETLDEVVVVGYGVQKKESLTGAMSTLKENRLKDVTTPTVENMLNGKVSGVYVAPGSGQPGSNGAVQIRGRATLSGSTSPLWVIDGVIVGEDPGVLNPSDIENMTILKDAASTAIYGSQGANGVIIVTTKMGKSEKMKINASVKLGVSTMTNGKMEVMNGAELYDYYASFPNQEDIKFSRWNPELRNANFDWGELASQAGFTQDYNISLSGGNEKMSSYFSLGYYSEEGTVKGYKYDRYSFRYRSNYKPFSWLTIKPNISGSMKNTDDSQYDYTAKYTMFPWDSPYDEDGNLVPDRYSGWVDSSDLNYLNSISYGNHTARKTYEFSGNFDFDIKITDWLTFTSVNNYRWTGYFQSTYTDPRTDSASGVQGRVEEEQTNNIQRYTNQYLTFNKIFGKHSVQALLAYEFMDTSAKVINAKGTGIVSGFEVLDATATPEEVGGNLTEWAKQSVFAKANYTYDNRYLAEVSLRRDGASNFGDDKKYGNFFSISAGWNINREKWFKADWVDVLKLRASYGSVGNIPYSKYPQYGLYSVSSNYNGIPAILISQVGNKDLTWEQTYTAGVGIDANFFNNRLRFVFDYYNKYTSNILYQVPVSGLTGITSRWQNVGEMRNSGIEITIGGDIIRTKDWLWSLDLNMGYNKNKLEKLYGDDPNMMIIGGGGNDTSIAGAAEKVLKVGYSTDRYYLREWAGVDPKNGAPLWYKNDGSGETTSNYSEAKQVMTEATSPKLFGGFNTSLTWKNIDLNASFGFSLGGKIYNYSRQEYDSDGAYTDRNQMKLIDGWSRWEKEGDIATHPAASYGNKSNSNKASTRYLEDGDYLKLRSLSIGYNLNLSKYYIQNMRIYFTAENVFTLTGFSGIDPEVPAYYDETTGTYKSIGTAGANLYPSTRKFMFGINLTF